jgi:hypothetical protein
VTSFAFVQPDLKFTVYCGDGAAAAPHPVRNFGKCHITVAEQIHDAIYLILGKILALRSDHLGLLPGISTPVNPRAIFFKGTITRVIDIEADFRGKLPH